jgi:hypothetical protein
MQDFFYKIPATGLHLSPWATSVIERLGLPLYFANEGEGAVFVDDFSVDGFTDEQIKDFMKGTLILSVNAADKLVSRGFAEELGVTVVSDVEKTDVVGVASVKSTAKVVTGERVRGGSMSAQYGRRELVPISDKTEWLSDVVHTDGKTGEVELLYPGVTRNRTSFGGDCIVFSGTPDMPFKYFSAFSLLNETRKKQFVEILSKNNLLHLYYPEDAELYLRAGRLSRGEYFAAAFNLSQDALEELPLVSDREVKRVEKLDENGERVLADFEIRDGVVYVKEQVCAMEPIVLILTV